MTSCLQSLGSLLSCPCSLLCLSCCLLRLSHPHYHFFNLLLKETCSGLSLCSPLVSLCGSLVRLCGPLLSLCGPLLSLCGSLLCLCNSLCGFPSSSLCFSHSLVSISGLPYEVGSGILCISGSSLGLFCSPL